MSEITELFGAESTVRMCWSRLPASCHIDLYRSQDFSIEDLRQAMAQSSIVGVSVSGGTGRSYASFAFAAHKAAQEIGSGLVFCNRHRDHEFFTVAPLALKYVASLRLHLKDGMATIVKHLHRPFLADCRLRANLRG